MIKKIITIIFTAISFFWGFSITQAHAHEFSLPDNFSTLEKEEQLEVLRDIIIDLEERVQLLFWEQTLKNENVEEKKDIVESDEDVQVIKNIEVVDAKEVFFIGGKEIIEKKFILEDGVVHDRYEQVVQRGFGDKNIDRRNVVLVAEEKYNKELSLVSKQTHYYYKLSEEENEASPYFIDLKEGARIKIMDVNRNTGKETFWEIVILEVLEYDETNNIEFIDDDTNTTYYYDEGIKYSMVENWDTEARIDGYVTLYVDNEKIAWYEIENEIIVRAKKYLKNDPSGKNFEIISEHMKEMNIEYKVI